MGERSTRISMVFPTIRYAIILHKLQYKLSIIRDVRNHLQKTNVAISAEQAQKDHHHQETVSIPVRLGRFSGALFSMFG